MKGLKKRKHKVQSNVALIIVAIFFVSIGIGFAYVQSILSIKGDTTIARKTKGLNIYFENIKITEGSVEALVEPVIDETNPTEIYFSAGLKKLGDFYEFEVDVVNQEENDVMVSQVIFDGIDNELFDLIDYSFTYSDGMGIGLNDLLPSGGKERVKIRIAYTEKADKAAEFADEQILSLSFGIEYVIDIGNGAPRAYSSLFKQLGLDKKAVVDNLPSDKVPGTTGIAFGTAPSETNGLGLYMRAGTKNTDNPIYYYRGAVTDNNVIFAGFCWKIIRTTETGGTKLIYNGTPASGTQCTNTTGTTTSISSSATKFNTYATSIADVGFMYGTRVAYTSGSTTAKYIFGDGIDYSDGVYTLTNPNTATTTPANRGEKHYSLLLTSTTGTKNTAYFFYYNNLYISLTAGDSLEDKLNEMDTNTTNSLVLNSLNTWYENNIENSTKHYEKYLEDAVWCNDRTISSGPLSGLQSAASAYSFFDGYVTRGLDGTDVVPWPAVRNDLACPSENDRFTTSTENGNGDLKHPIGLITADEATLAGSGLNSGAASSSYLYTNQTYWTMTPYKVQSTAMYMYTLASTGKLSGTSSAGTAYVRPVISLKAGVKVSEGDGTSTNPYVIDTTE